MSEEDWSIRERIVSSSAVGALRNALTGMNLGLSESQAMLIDEVVSPLIREAVVTQLRTQFASHSKEGEQ